MNVYLFSLDSVRNSTPEVEAGQEEMFRQILCYGNDVVLSFNQLTDSKALLAVLPDERNYEAFMKLISMGKVKVSQHGAVRTPSQYLQEAIRRSLSQDGHCFYFSGLPLNGVDHRGDMLLLQKALAYSDPQLFYERAEEDRWSGHGEEAEREELFARYVRMILLLSSAETAHIPVIGKSQPASSLADYIRRVVSLEVPGVPEAREAQGVLAGILHDHGAEPALENKRSNWYRWLSTEFSGSAEKGTRDRAFALAEAMVDLCYCYAVEEEIPHITRHFVPPETFGGSFGAELSKYWKSFTDGVHVSHVLQLAHGSGDGGKQPPSSGPKLPDWTRAAAVMELCGDDGDEGSSPFITLKRAGLRKLVPRGSLEKSGGSRSHMEIRQREWFHFIRGQLYANFLFALIGMLLFVAIEGVVNVLQDRFQSAIVVPGLLDPVLLVLGASVISIILFSIFSSVLENTLHIPDILDSFQYMGKIIRIRRFMKRETAGRQR